MKNLVFFVTISFFIITSAFAQQPNQRVNSGQATSPVIFPVTGCAYTWTNDKPEIGLAASGAGDILTFTAKNTGTSPVTATITVTPVTSSYAYVANYGSDNVSVISMTTNKVVATIPVGSAPWGVSVSPDGRRVYVSNHNSDNVSVINTATNKVVATVPVGKTPKALAVSPDGSRVYVTDSASNSISVINTANNKTLSPIRSYGLGPQGICVTPTGDSLYVCNAVSQTQVLINTRLGDSILSVKLSYDPISIAVNANGRYIYECGDGSLEYHGTKPNDPNWYYSQSKTITYSQIMGSADGKFTYATMSKPARLFVGPYRFNSVYWAPLPIASAQGISETMDTRKFCIADGRDSVYIFDAYPYERALAASGPPIIPQGVPMIAVKVGSRPISIGNFIGPNLDCGSGPYTFTITVNPPSPHVINAGNVNGTISACAGTPSASPDIQQFDVSGSNLLNDITATAPDGFELSLTGAGGYGNTITLAAANGTINTTTIYARSSTGAKAGNISGAVTLSSDSSFPVTVTLAGDISPIPAVNAIPNISVPDGRVVNPATFGGTAPGYTWANDNTGIGLAAGGSGNMPAFIGLNKTNKPVIANITVTPLNDNGCPGAPVIFTIRINPLLTVPNTFTPNGDGINDSWNIKNLDSYPNCVVRIFGRSGVVVYSSIGYAKPWDGKRNGSNLPSGTYYYIVDPKDGETVFSGWVALIR